MNRLTIYSFDDQTSSFANAINTSGPTLIVWSIESDGDGHGPAVLTVDTEGLKGEHHFITLGTLNMAEKGILQGSFIDQGSAGSVAMSFECDNNGTFHIRVQSFQL